jgi:hypothetical protein
VAAGGAWGVVERPPGCAVSGAHEAASERLLREAMEAAPLGARDNPGIRRRLDLYFVVRHDTGEITVRLYREPKDLYAAQVGFVRAERLEESPDGSCGAALARLRRLSGAPLLAPYVIVESNVAEDLRGSRLGTWMYAEASRVAAGRGEAIMSSACAGGQTSTAASMLWLGDSLRRVALVDGMVAVWKGGEDNPAPPGVRLRPYGAWADRDVAAARTPSRRPRRAT